MPHTHVEVSKTGFQGVPHEINNCLKLHRAYEDRPTDRSHYLMTWIGTIDAGKPIHGHFFGPAVMYAIEGEFELHDDSKPDNITKFVAGDVLHIDVASDMTWTSPTHGKAFAVCYAPIDRHPEDLVVSR